MRYESNQDQDVCARCQEPIPGRSLYTLVRHPRRNRTYYTPAPGNWSMTRSGWKELAPERIPETGRDPAKQYFRRRQLEPREMGGESYHQHCLLEQLRENARAKKPAVRTGPLELRRAA